jgi:hypothetical protein
MHDGLLNKYIDWSEHNGDISLKESLYNKFRFIKVQRIIRKLLWLTILHFKMSICVRTGCTLKRYYFINVKCIISWCPIVQSIVFLVDYSKKNYFLNTKNFHWPLLQVV